MQQRLLVLSLFAFAVFACGTGRGATHPQPAQARASAEPLKSADVTEYAIPTSNSGAGGGMAVGPDGNVWFTEQNSSKVASITPNGTITECHSHREQWSDGAVGGRGRQPLVYRATGEPNGHEGA